MSKCDGSSSSKLHDYKRENEELSLSKKNEELQKKIEQLEKRVTEKDKDFATLAKLLVKGTKSNDERQVESENQREIEENQKKIKQLEDEKSNLKALLLTEKEEHDKKIKELKEDTATLTQLLLREKKNNDQLIEEYETQMKMQKEEFEKKNAELEEELYAKEAMDTKSESELLKEKQERIEELEELNNTLILKEKLSNEELQEARKELINKLKDKPRGGSVGIKKMGELDIGPFVRAMKKRYRSSSVAEHKATEECSHWEKCLRDPHWHPFTTNSNNEEVVDIDDEKLKAVKEDPDLGIEVYNAIATALTELNEYNPSGRFPAPELWNFEEQRKATLKECILTVRKMSGLKRKRTCG